MAEAVLAPPDEMECVAQRPASMTDKPLHYCPGCTHGILHRLVAEMLDEFELADRAVMVCPVGCAVFAYNYLECDMVQASHGRAPHHAGQGRRQRRAQRAHVRCRLGGHRAQQFAQ